MIEALNVLEEKQVINIGKFLIEILGKWDKEDKVAEQYDIGEVLDIMPECQDEWCEDYAIFLLDICLEYTNSDLEDEIINYIRCNIIEKFKEEIKNKNGNPEELNDIIFQRHNGVSYEIEIYRKNYGENN